MDCVHHACVFISVRRPRSGPGMRILLHSVKESCLNRVVGLDMLATIRILDEVHLTQSDTTVLLKTQPQGLEIKAKKK